MCTVSYIPYKRGFVLTSNRDEDPLRVTTLPQKTTLANGTVITAPRDVLEGGTWVAIDENGRAACLLNGAFLKHIRQSDYRRSRGHFVIEAFEAASFDDFAASVFLDDIEPFTLLLIEPERIRKLVWDGNKKRVSELPSDTVHLWSSVTLYTPEEHAAKESYFFNALKEDELTKERILRLHGKGDDTPFIINRPKARTVSITQSVYDGENTSLTYFLKNRYDERSIPNPFTLI